MGSRHGDAAGGGFGSREWALGDEGDETKAGGKASAGEGDRSHGLEVGEIAILRSWRGRGRENLSRFRGRGGYFSQMSPSAETTGREETGRLRSASWPVRNFVDITNVYHTIGATD